jgi:hypothetical protein
MSPRQQAVGVGVVDLEVDGRSKAFVYFVLL